MKNLKWLILLIISVGNVIAQEQGICDGPFTICGKITGVKPGFLVKMALFSNQEDYNSKKYTKAYKFTKEQITGDSVIYCFHGIKEGEYILVAFQDLNGDGKINYNWVGIPVEPYQFYKPVGPHTRPTFANCKFRVTSNLSHIDIPLMNSK